MPRTAATASDRLTRKDEEPEDYGHQTESPIENLIVIGASAGGHQAIKEVVRGLSPDIPAALILMLHRGTGQPPPPKSYDFERWLGGSTYVPIKAIQPEERLQRGIIYVTPPGASVSLQGRVLHLEPRDNILPATTINRLFESAAREYHDRVIGVVLSGFLSDGTIGLKAVHDAGGLTIVEDPVTAKYPDMPSNAMHGLPVTFCLSLREIGVALDILARRTTTLETGLAVSVRMLKERMAVLVGLLAQSKHNPSTHRFLSTEMQSLVQDLSSVNDLLAHAIAMAKEKATANTPLS